MDRLEKIINIEAILDGMGDGITIEDTSFRILYMNPAQKAFWGDCVGRHCYEAYHGRDAVCDPCQVAMTFADGKPHTIENSGVKDGVVVYREITASPLRDATGKIVAAVEVVRDISERKMVERRFEHLNRLYSIVSETNKAISRTRDRQKLMEEACRIAVLHGLFRMAWVGLVDRALGTVTPAACWGAVEGYLDGIRISADDGPEGRGPVGRAVRTGRASIFNDVEKDPDMAPWREKALSHGYLSIAAFPITSEDGVIGAFAVYSGGQGMFDAEEASLMEGLAQDISYALGALGKEEKRRIAVEALRESEERVRTIADTAMDAIVMIGSDGRVSYWNPAAEKIFGYAKDEAMGRDLHELVMPDRYRAEFERRLAAGFGRAGAVPTRSRPMEFTGVGKGRGEFPVEVSISSVKVKGEWSFVGVIRDITERKRAEDLLRKSRARVEFFGNAINLSSQPFGVGYPDGRIGFVNKALEQLTGYDAKELRAINWAIDLTPPEWRDAEMMHLEEMNRTGRPARYEKEYIRKDGSRVPVEILINLVKGREGNPEYYYAFVTDISERKAAEAMLRESEQRYKDLVELSYDFIYRSDRYGNQTFMNDAAFRMLEANQEDVVGKPWEIWIHPDDREGTRRCFMEMVEKGIDAFNFENRFVSKNGRVINVLHNVRVLRDEKGAITGTQGIARDITERKRAEEALKESELLFRSLVEESLVGVFIIQDGRFAYVNPRGAEMFGYTQEEVAGLGVMDAIHPDDRAVVEDRIRKLYAGDASRATQFKCVRKDGGIIEVEALASFTVYKGAPALIGAGIDITDRIRAEEEKNALFHMLTHDIKGPLSVIYGYADMVRQVADRDAPEIAGEMQKAAGRISALIDDMLSLSRLESKAGLLLGPVSLAPILKAAMRDNEALATEKGISIAIDADPALPRVHADGAQLTRAFSNLVANAVRYSRKGGSVRISAECGEDGTVKVQVSDKGDGIVREDMPHLFDKYFRGKRSGKKPGTGLGLAIVKAAVDAHGGTVSAESAIGKGSTFTVVLPVKR